MGAAAHALSDRRARPSPANVAAFLKANGIDYIYADAVHPNTLVPDAVPIATIGETTDFSGIPRDGFRKATHLSSGDRRST